MSNSPRYPQGPWPAEMRADMAAAYVDEKNEAAFRDKVRRGIYSPPARGKGCLAKWAKAALDEDIAKRHGRGQDTELLTDAAGML